MNITGGATNKANLWHPAIFEPRGASVVPDFIERECKLNEGKGTKTWRRRTLGPV